MFKNLNNSGRYKKNKKDFLPSKKKVHIIRFLKKKVNLSNINKVYFLYNGLFFNKKYTNFFIFGNFFSDFIITKKF